MHSSPNPLPEYAVEIAGLAKTYAARRRQPAKTALAGVDLAIPRGSLFGLLGPNGAGKSTTINILAGLVRKTAGQVTIWGYDIDRQPLHARHAIGVVPQELHIDPFFTPREALEMHAGMFGVAPAARRTDEILAALGLADKADAYARSLSGGMRRRLLIGKALVHNPPVLVLDEPTAGVDVELRQQLWSYVRTLAGRGTTVLLTTHYLEEAEALCDRIAIIDRGQVVACDTTRALVHRLDRKTLVVTVADALDAVPAALADLGATLLDPLRIAFRYQPSRTRVQDLLGAMQAAALSVVDLTTEEGTLEDAFLALTRPPAAAA
ncbi:multidrug ABC transporter ATP-binding protein [Allostella humosa]|uniref:ABC transporter ATP-binding protein n=1 Tax=Stella humosa TaxID=94 RepID=UPI00113B396A|nr:ABC transporter ATP-binding protein [Stella humosa]BBK34106.1 multidrug ABC transporter ATP-binding protein [Stella humosa]